MSYQKCPVCNGSGKMLIENPLQYTATTIQLKYTNVICHTCAGAGIIDETTGKPPQSEVKDLTPLNNPNKQL